MPKPYDYYIALRNSAEDNPYSRARLNALADLVLQWIGQHTSAPTTPLPDELQQRVDNALEHERSIRPRSSEPP